MGQGLSAAPSRYAHPFDIAIYRVCIPELSDRGMGRGESHSILSKRLVLFKATFVAILRCLWSWPSVALPVRAKAPLIVTPHGAILPSSF